MRPSSLHSTSEPHLVFTAERNQLLSMQPQTLICNIQSQAFLSQGLHAASVLVWQLRTCYTERVGQLSLFSVLANMAAHC